eukprot:1206065-Rhodomonas_salina.2
MDVVVVVVVAVARAAERASRFSAACPGRPAVAHHTVIWDRALYPALHTIPSFGTALCVARTRPHMGTAHSVALYRAQRSTVRYVATYVRTAHYEALYYV